MKIGTVKEIKDKTETRVGLTPTTIKELVSLGHQVYVERDAGRLSQISDKDYEEAGAKILPEARDVWENVELMVKVKEPQEDEFKYLRPDLTLFTYLHLASPASKNLVEAALKSKGVFIAYETVILEDGTKPLLAPMSEIAGQKIVDIASVYLSSPDGIMNKMINRIRQEAGRILIIGGGVVGENAAYSSLARGASVMILELKDKKREELKRRLQPLANCFGGRVQVLESSKENLQQGFKLADIIIGSIYIPGARAERLIKHEDLELMKEGTVIGDVAIDQGGVCEFSRITNIHEPSFIVKAPRSGKRIIVIGIPNIPAMVGTTATRALNSATREYIKKYAQEGMRAVLADSSFSSGVNIAKGRITFESVARAHGMDEKFLSPGKLFV
ncbi:hypothetical protein AMJ50_01270 [Parcubacteria bacterium DG_74_3]|nr:MAG: hypothetical protein AMJ50_01270 [Parcubacteria bacterium DG_74_3]